MGKDNKIIQLSGFDKFLYFPENPTKLLMDDFCDAQIGKHQINTKIFLIWMM